jgi:hypothetical protein
VSLVDSKFIIDDFQGPIVCWHCDSTDRGCRAYKAFESGGSGSVGTCSVHGRAVECREPVKVKVRKWYQHSKVSIVRTACVSHQRLGLLEIFLFVTTDPSNVSTVDRLPSLIFIIFLAIGADSNGFEKNYPKQQSLVENEPESLEKGGPC